MLSLVEITVFLSNARAFPKYASDNFSSKISCFPAIKKQGWSEKNTWNNKVNGTKRKIFIQDKASEYSLACLDEINVVIEITQIFINT